MQIGFVSRWPLDDRRAASGTNFKLFEALSQRHSVVHIPYRPDAVLRAYSHGLEWLARLRGKNFSVNFTRLASRRLARSLDKHLVEKVDLLFFPLTTSCLAGLQTDKPTVYLSDATFESLYDYYPSHSNFMKFNYQQGNAVQRKALDHATTVIVGAGWAQASAVADYGQHPGKVHVIEFGANLLDDDPTTIRTFCDSVRGDDHDERRPLTLLFVGVDWARKGGDIAVECCRALNDHGIASRLHVVGTEVPLHHRDDNLVTHGFLDKNDPVDVKCLNELMATAHLLILPTQAECTGIVFCEASAYGLPSFTIDTGGISDYVRNGVNGYRLPPGSTGVDFARKISEVISSNELGQLSEGAFETYASRLNWRRWLERFDNVTRGLHSDD
ncbi:glycosyltransferase family 4 protein [Kocuria sp. CH-021]|uniref:glycosyltransferase family 4 protein n=1 Tax=Kocuria sp. CH-021 TaxID=3406735 RepID=UPI003C7853EE